MTEEELDKLAEKYQEDNTIIRYYGPGNGSVPEYNKTMEEVFKDGWNACKEQMMKEAISCKVFWHDGPLLDYTQEQQDNALERIGAHVGDKVRLIIVKED